MSTQWTNSLLMQTPYLIYICSRPYCRNATLTITLVGYCALLLKLYRHCVIVVVIVSISFYWFLPFFVPLYTFALYTFALPRALYFLLQTFALYTLHYTRRIVYEFSFILIFSFSLHIKKTILLYTTFVSVLLLL